MLDSDGNWAVSPDETLAYVMTRDPIEEDAMGNWYVDQLLFRWVQVPYLAANECAHQGTMCADCQECWFDDYHVQLRTRDGLHVCDFDELVRAELKKQGIPEPPLSQYLEIYFGATAE